MNKSRLISQDKIYVRFDYDGNTQLMNSNSISPGYSYRRVHDKLQNFRSIRRAAKNQKFNDDKFIVSKDEFPQIDLKNGRVILKRLYDLIKITGTSQNKPMFFPPQNYIPPKKLSKDPLLPPAVTQMGIFSTQHYKSFFITQNFSQNGLYQLIINHEGRFQLDVVDDWVPVYEKSLEPIWGMDFDQSWQIILLKFWAKRQGGYSKIKKTPPFSFLQSFSNSNWKFFNLQRQGQRFLQIYQGKSEIGKFVLKTKNNNQVLKSGLIPNSAGYQMIDLINLNQRNFQKNSKNINNVLRIRSTLNNQWSGKMSVLDHEVNSLYFPEKSKMSLQRDFMINQHDFLNCFSSCYVASRRDQKQKNYISDYYLFNIQPENKKSVYIKFNVPQDGWLDFCIIQPKDNRVVLNQTQTSPQTLSMTSSSLYGSRYLKCRYILVKQNNANSPSISQDPNYIPPIYDTYQIQCSHGHNRGQARFLNIVKGNYILKIKPQSSNKVSYFIVNYASNSLIQFKQHFPTKQQSGLILRQAMSSLIGILSNYSLDKNRKDQQICFSNTFQQLGYGFVGARLKKTCPYRILIDVDPVQVRSSGYKIKNQFKKCNQPFSILLSSGQSTSIVLKKVPGMNYVWPPKGIQIFKQIEYLI